jgi:hypothetical protein
MSGRAPAQDMDRGVDRGTDRTGPVVATRQYAVTTGSADSLTSMTGGAAGASDLTGLLR